MGDCGVEDVDERLPMEGGIDEDLGVPAVPKVLVSHSALEALYAPYC